jgi:hypothetical protein
MQNCDITGNSTLYVGGGIDTEAACELSQYVNLYLTNCKITTNVIGEPGWSGYGAGIFSEGCARVYAVNCTFVGNSGPAVHMWPQWDTLLLLTNSVVYFNNGGGQQLVGAATTAFCDIQGGDTANGNKNVNPMLNPSTLELLTASPCIDAGNPNSVFNDTYFPPSLGGVRNDMGAFGGPGASDWLGGPTIVSQPQNQTVPEGSNATFAVMATGAPPLSYQWLLNGATISGATTTNYTINNVQAADNGSLYSVVVSNAAGSTNSAVAVLKVLLPHAATATATVVNGFVVGAAVTDGGFGYTNTPGVRFIGGGGSGAQAVAVVSNGLVTAVNILNPGSGYTTTPVIVIAPPFIPQPTMGIAAMSLLSFTSLAVGTNYQLEYFSGSLLTTVGSPFTATSSTYTQLVSGTVSTSSYRLTVTPAPTQAHATAQVVNGFVVGAAVTSGGSGYTTDPAVIISGGGGSNATAIVTNVIGGSVTGIRITNPGSGYTNTPNIIIALPPATSLGLDSVTQVMKIHLESLSPYDNYQLEFTTFADGTWSNSGTLLTPTSAATTLYINVAGNAGFFRVRHMP